MNPIDNLVSPRNALVNQDTITSSLNALVEKHRFSEALDYLGKFDAALTPDILLAKTKAYYGLGNYTQMLDIIALAEYIEWDTYEFYFLKGKALFSLKEYESANEAFEKSHKMHPTQESQEALFRCQIKLFREQKPNENVTILHP